MTFMFTITFYFCWDHILFADILLLLSFLFAVFVAAMAVPGHHSIEPVCLFSSCRPSKHIYLISMADVNVFVSVQRYVHMANLALWKYRKLKFHIENSNDVTQPNDWTFGYCINVFRYCMTWNNMFRVDIKFMIKLCIFIKAAAVSKHFKLEKLENMEEFKIQSDFPWRCLEKCFCSCGSAAENNSNSLLLERDPASSRCCWAVRARWVSWINIYGSVNMSYPLSTRWSGCVGFMWEEIQVKNIHKIKRTNQMWLWGLMSLDPTSAVAV